MRQASNALLRKRWFTMATTSSLERTSISQILRSLSETLFWGVTACGLILFSLSSVLQLLQLSSQTFVIFLGLRLTLAALAVAALLWRSVGNDLTRMAAPVMMIIVMSERVFELGWLGPEAVSIASLDYAALLFLAAGAIYRGKSRRWWSTLMPWAILNQLILLMELTQKSDIKINDLIQSGLIIGIGFLGCCVFFAVRSARVVESQAVYDRSVEAVTSLKEVQEEIKLLVGLLTAKEKVAAEMQASEFVSHAVGSPSMTHTQALIEKAAGTSATSAATSAAASAEGCFDQNADSNTQLTADELIADELGAMDSKHENSSNRGLEMQAVEVGDWRELSSSRQSALQVALHYPLPSQIPADELLEPSAVFEILKEIVSRKGAAIQKEWDNTKARDRAFKAQTRLSLNAPTESAWPIVVRANKSFLRDAFHSLLLRAIESANSSGQGIVRVNFRVGLSIMSISVEDNGRGFSEEKLRSLSFPETYLSTLSTAIEQRPTFLDISEIRERLEEEGNDFDFQARLGVGTRAILDFPRLDAYSSEKIRASKTLEREVETRRL